MEWCRRYDSDPEINNYFAAWHRAGATAILAIGLCVAYALCTYLSSVNGLQPVFATIPRFLATVFGWGAIGAVVLTIGRYAYAYLYPLWLNR